MNRLIFMLEWHLFLSPRLAHLKLRNNDFVGVSQFVHCRIWCLAPIAAAALRKQRQRDTYPNAKILFTGQRA